MFRLGLLILALFLATSCHRKQPKDILSENDMQSLLYDYHISKAMASQTDSAEYYKRYYFLQVLKQHHLTEDQFNKSLLWYNQHTATLYKIYEQINKRILRESMTLGAVASESHYYNSLTASGDTANIWNGSSYYILSQIGVNNRFSFRIEPDSTVQPHDTYLFHFISKFVFSDGQRDAVAELYVTYDDGSVQNASIRIYGDGPYQCELRTSEKKLTAVSGFVYLKSEYSEKPRLLFITRPALIRFHEKVQEVKESPDTKMHVDTLRRNTDSIMPDPTVMDHRPVPRTKPVPFRKHR